MNIPNDLPERMEASRAELVERLQEMLAGRESTSDPAREMRTMQETATWCASRSWAITNEEDAFGFDEGELNGGWALYDEAELADPIAVFAQRSDAEIVCNALMLLGQLVVT